MFQPLLVQLSIVHYEPFGCTPRLSHQKTGAAMLGVVPIFLLPDQAIVDTFLYPSLYLIGLLFRSRVGSPAYLVNHELGLQLEVHLYQLVTGGWRGYFSEYLKVGPEKLLYSRVQEFDLVLHVPFRV